MTVLAQVTLSHKSGIPQDNVVNTFTFSEEATAGVADDIETALTDFYNGVAAGATDVSMEKVAELLSPDLSRTEDVMIECFDLLGALDGSPHGAPYATRFFTLDAEGSITRLPAETALALSFRSEYGTAEEDVPAGAPGPPGNIHERARLRGRVFIGPLCATGVGVAGPDFTLRPAFNTQNTILQAGVRLRDNVDLTWVVWSRANASVNAVSRVWVDDSFDVIRGRGPDPLSRMTNP